MTRHTEVLTLFPSCPQSHPKLIYTLSLTHCELGIWIRALNGYSDCCIYLFGTLGELPISLIVQRAWWTDPLFLFSRICCSLDSTLKTQDLIFSTMHVINHRTHFGMNRKCCIITAYAVVSISLIHGIMNDRQIVLDYAAFSQSFGVRVC